MRHFDSKFNLLCQSIKILQTNKKKFLQHFGLILICNQAPIWKSSPLSISLLNYNLPYDAILSNVIAWALLMDILQYTLWFDSSEYPTILTVPLRYLQFLQYHPGFMITALMIRPHVLLE